MIQLQSRARRAQAFNEGSDARVSGRLAFPNPYGADEELANQWRKGWWHVEDYSAKDVSGRWPIKPLPRVPGVLR